jgi:diguanylate cyclase (GGDEF)-like protein
VKKFLDFLEAQPRRQIFSLAVASTILLGFLDYLTGFEIAFSFFYLLPVFLAAWAGGKRVGTVVSIACTLVWFVANNLAGETFSNPLIPYWNAITRLGFFLVVAWLASELHMMYQSERDLARTDALTGALNRRAFYEILEAEMLRAQRYAHPFTIVYFDLDNFKSINDRLGHTTGDAVLKEIVAVLNSQVRSVDTICRLGGDEFAILMPETGEQTARTAALRMQTTMQDSMKKQEIHVTFSIGALVCQASPTNAGELLALADRLMYKVKLSGKNNVALEIYPSNP